MRYMLDTNICIYLIKKHPPEIAAKFNGYRKGEILISSITWAELCCGITKDGFGVAERLLSLLEVAPFGVEQGRIYGELTELWPNRKRTLNRMIAAHALSLAATLVTNNTADFETYAPQGLAIENWVGRA
ncbi:MAG: type II toxin-antitoxin system VapC family toxin [Burkholderiaceae bacterium]|jgi:tRNA(fMet)-specific endonuclease VapC|nr:type II toxin-antitoxin system VapC family toxin [Burkholderiaceae bacterium]